MKKILSLVLASILALSAVGCGDNDEGGANVDTTKPVTIKFANYGVLEEGYKSFWNAVKADFEKDNPNITVEYVTAPYGEIVNQVINMAGGGDKVDMIFGEISWIPTLEDSGLTVPVTDVLSSDFLADFYDNQLEACSINGKPYGIPMYVSPFVLYYNKDLFTKAGLDPENPPKTYDEMLVAAEALSKLKTEDGNKVYAFGQTTASVPISGSSVMAMINNFGGQVLDADGKLDVDTDAFKQAIEMLKTLDDKGYNPQNAKLKDLRNLFALGQLGMYYDQSWGFNGVQSINPDAKNFTASTNPLAGGSGTGESGLQAHVLAFMDNGAEKKAAVAKFVEYLITEDTLSKENYLPAKTPAYPARKSMENMSAISESPILKGAMTSVSKTVATTFIPQLNELNLELCTLAQNVTVGDEDVDSAIAKFKKAAEPLTK